MGDDVFVIQGVDEDGAKLRPGDWIERISSSLASFGTGKRLQYARSVQPCIVNGEKCLAVARGLEQSNPEAFAFVMGFARSNRLRILEDRRRDDRALLPV